MDYNISPFCEIKDGILFDGTKEPVAITIENILKSFHWLDLTRFKACILKQKMLKMFYKRKRGAMN